MKRPPYYIIYKQALRYLDAPEKEILKKELDFINSRHKRFLTKLTKCFDIEKFRVKPLIWQDIWLYNYIKYEVVDGVKRSGLIALYEKEAFIENDAEFFAKKEILNAKKISGEYL